MLSLHTHIVRLAERYAAARRIARSTLAREATGSSTWFERCGDGRVTIRSALAVVEWFAEHWPDEVAWPEEIPRPAPSVRRMAGTPNEARLLPVEGVAMADAGPTGTPNGEARAPGTERDREGTVGDAAVQSTGSAGPSLAVAMHLGPAGQIASPMTLCRALGVRRYVYDDVVRRYRDGIGGGRDPRPDSDCARVLSALVAAGDTRFASRREGPAT